MIEYFKPPDTKHNFLFPFAYEVEEEGHTKEKKKTVKNIAMSFSGASLHSQDMINVF